MHAVPEHIRNQNHCKSEVHDKKVTVNSHQSETSRDAVKCLHGYIMPAAKWIMTVTGGGLLA